MVWELSRIRLTPISKIQILPSLAAGADTWPSIDKPDMDVYREMRWGQVCRVPVPGAAQEHQHVNPSPFSTPGDDCLSRERVLGSSPES
jgi:hypothetical protein